MKYLGAHIDSLPSISNIPGLASDLGATAFAFCPIDPKRWSYPSYAESEVLRFRSECEHYGFGPANVLPHASLLLNLCSPDSQKLRLSRTSLVDQMKRCEALGLDRLNFHPGSHMRQLSEEDALALVADSINYALDATRNVTAVVENMAGQGSNLGYSFDHLAYIIDRVEDKSRVGVCIDTCHAFAAGYDLSDEGGYDAAWSRFDQTIGFSMLKGMHINDSLKGAGSRVDRHAPIGWGELGSSFFGRFMSDSRFDGVPLILETPDPSVWKMEIDWLRSCR